MTASSTQSNSRKKSSVSPPAKEGALTDKSQLPFYKKPPKPTYEIVGEEETGQFALLKLGYITQAEFEALEQVSRSRLSSQLDGLEVITAISAETQLPLEQILELATSNPYGLVSLVGEKSREALKTVGSVLNSQNELKLHEVRICLIYRLLENPADLSSAGWDLNDELFNQIPKRLIDATHDFLQAERGAIKTQKKNWGNTLNNSENT
ncbi:hypothetical protein [Gloeothece verrucosa]|uniref:Uncharacterized protein n=1 Tax=Gloeothece verrucosa (strain PCC 7822) TaxID=497965 RepID=E0ULY5_GLOV7|nr:hypothetical protein [Gloeothece verrucosa]ADN17965.1 hypothetical protein Cyan7822_6134 [Gloeothece verrucosa PCC 7822]